MKSTIRIDVDKDDKPVIVIRHDSSSNDLRDKSLGSFLKKLGFTHAFFNQEAALKIEYESWYGSDSGGSGEQFTIRPIEATSRFTDEQPSQWLEGMIEENRHKFKPKSNLSDYHWDKKED